MYITEDNMRTISNHVGIKVNRLIEMYNGKRGDREQLLAHVLCGVPLSFYDDIILCNVENKVCEIFPCLKDDDLDVIFSRTLMNIFRKSSKYYLMFMVLKSTPSCYIDSCKIKISTYNHTLNLFVSVKNKKVCKKCLFNTHCKFIAN